MNSFFVYVLFSQSLDRFYIGLTTLSVEERLENHLAKKNMMPKTSLKKQMTGL
ncbi:GIY-YIG nuclease family protein [Algoriphagus lacus]